MGQQVPQHDVRAELKMNFFGVVAYVQLQFNGEYYWGRSTSLFVLGIFQPFYSCLVYNIRYVYLYYVIQLIQKYEYEF
jgi:hypothetical protein